MRIILDFITENTAFIDLDIVKNKMYWYVCTSKFMFNCKGYNNSCFFYHISSVFESSQNTMYTSFSHSVLKIFRIRLIRRKLTFTKTAVLFLAKLVS